MSRMLPLLLFLGLPAALALADGGERLREDTTIQVTTALVLETDRYIRPDPEGDGVLVIETDGVTVDLGGATLVGCSDPGADPDEFTGIAIHVRNAKDVTIKNGKLRGYKIGVRAEHAVGLRLENIDASGNFRQRLFSNPDREDLRDWLRPHDNDDCEWETKYGAGFSLVACEASDVVQCRVRHGQNGVLLTRCEHCDVYDNDFSFNSGWGIALYRTRLCDISHNRCDWCVRGYSHGVYFRGQDSAGILVFEQSCDNRFVANSATHGGDGFFLYAGRDTTDRTGEGGSNHNIVLENDFSHAVANGIEATFSKGNVFVGNDVSDCDHGLWLGYSYESEVIDNRAIGCMSAGISIEHGRQNSIAGNTIEGGRAGIDLWWDDDKAFIEGVYGQTHDTSSSKNRIWANTIRGADTAIRLVADTETTIYYTVLEGTRIALDLGSDTRTGAVMSNRFQGSHGRRPDDPTPPTLIRNRSGAVFELSGSNMIAGRFKLIPPGSGARAVTLGDGESTYVEQAATRPAPPQAITGSLDASLAESTPRGREQIRIDEWGPLDPTESAVFPRRVTGGREAVVHVLGKGPFVAQVVGHVVVDLPWGAAPAQLVVRPKGKTPTGLFPFTITVTMGGKPYVAEGLLLVTTWDVRMFEWTVDPRDDDEAFQALLRGEPKARFDVSLLELPWRSGGEEGVRADRFATLATTTLELPKGRYRIRSISDDGIRVYVDGKRVIDNWTHHAPTEDEVELDIEAGKHTLRVEHFEIDGWAHLQVSIEPME